MELNRNAQGKWLPNLLLVAMGWLSAAPLSAQVTGFRVDSYHPDPAVLSGYVVNDMLLDFRSQYTGSQLMLDLAEGTIYQHPLGGHQAPDANLVAHIPELAYDTFFALGSSTLGGPHGDPLLVGQPCNIVCPPSITDQTINLAWASVPSIPIRDQQDFLTARITLSEDAQGTWNFFVSAAGQFFEVPPQPIINGRMVLIPEPATWILVLGAVVGGSVVFMLRARLVCPATIEVESPFHDVL